MASDSGHLNSHQPDSKSRGGLGGEPLRDSGRPVDGGSGAGGSTADVRADAPVAVVSAFGRGNWLALELARRGFRVTFIDVTANLGEIDPEDAEGPFGLFEASDLQAAQRAALETEGELRTVPGFTLWLADGPLEIGGERTADWGLDRFRQLDISEASIRYVSRAAPPDRAAERELRGLAKARFRENWPAYLAHQLTSTRHEENHRALEIGSAAPLGARFSIRQMTRQGWRRGHEALRAAGVNVREEATVRDLRLNGRNVDALEIGDDHAGIERARAFVWLLSSAESKRFPEKLFQTIFPGGPAEPDWYWQRFVLQLGGARPVDELPDFIVALDDPYLPWSQGNLAVLKRRHDARQFDLWMKVPSAVRSDEVRMQTIRLDVETRLQRRMPRFEPEVRPVTYAKSPLKKNAGPVPVQQMVFRENAFKNMEILGASNFFFCGPERCESLDWLGTFRAQGGVLTQLEKLKAQWDQAARKLAAKEASP